MTESDAKKILQRDLLIQIENKALPDGIEAIKIAIKALEEVQQYRQVGTVDECREAVEKQTPKEPDYEGDGYWNGQLVYDTWICPSCGKDYEVDCDNYDCCPKCGQKIDWRTNNEVD